MNSLRAMPMSRAPESEAPVSLGTPNLPVRAGKPKDGGLRTWWDIAAILAKDEKLGCPQLCAQTIINDHDRALKKIKKELMEKHRDVVPVRVLDEPELAGSEW